jgi:hypothetical protein
MMELIVDLVRKHKLFFQVTERPRSSEVERQVSEKWSTRVQSSQNDCSTLTVSLGARLVFFSPPNFKRYIDVSL